MTVTVSRNGDLIQQCYLQTNLPAITSASSGSGFSWIPDIGHHLIKNVECEIGGQRIDKHYGHWLSIFNSLTIPTGLATGYDNMIGNVSSYTGAFPAFAIASGSVTLAARRLWVPLQFWFNRNPGLALPLVALQYHEVKFHVEFDSYARLHRGLDNGTTPSLGTTSLYVDYIYLDVDERRRFAQTAHEYLIEQLQFTGDENLSGTSNKIKLNFNHPIKELIWTVVRDDNVDSSNNEYQHRNNFTDKHIDDDGDNPVSVAKLQMNGHDRFSERQGNYFNWVQQYQHHTNVADTGICTYSFANKPEEYQPNGTANFSRLDNVTLNITLTSAMSGVSAFVRIYAVNYNVLRVLAGMGGLAYAN